MAVYSGEQAKAEKERQLELRPGQECHHGHHLAGRNPWLFAEQTTKAGRTGKLFYVCFQGLCLLLWEPLFAPLPPVPPERHLVSGLPC